MKPRLLIVISGGRGAQSVAVGRDCDEQAEDSVLNHAARKGPF